MIYSDGGLVRQNRPICPRCGTTGYQNAGCVRCLIEHVQDCIEGPRCVARQLLAQLNASRRARR